MGAIYRKEIKAYFHSMSGYLFIGFFLAIIGLYHYVYNYAYGLAAYSNTMSAVTLFFIFLVPILSMRIMAEENRQKTDQLLFTSPISVTKVMVGKYLAMLTLLGIVMGSVCLQPAILSQYGNVNFAGAYVSILGIFLLGATYISIGLFVSSVTESQVVAAVVTFVIILFTNLVDAIAGLFGTDAFTAWIVFAVCFIVISAVTYFTMHNAIVTAGVFAVTELTLALIYLIRPVTLEGSIEKVFGWFSVIGRLGSFTAETFSLADTVYYLSVSAVFVFLSIQSVEKRRWN